MFYLNYYNQKIGSNRGTVYFYSRRFERSSYLRHYGNSCYRAAHTHTEINANRSIGKYFGNGDGIQEISQC